MRLCNVLSLVEYTKINLGHLKEVVQLIPLSDWKSRVDPESYETLVIRENDSCFPKAAIQKVLDDAISILGPGYTNRVVLSCVPAGKGILPHTDDFGEVIRKTSSHYHIPIVTDPSVIMGIDGQEYHLKEGYLYKMDETKTHYVKNPSATNRVHLLFAHFPH